MSFAFARLRVYLLIAAATFAAAFAGVPSARAEKLYVANSAINAVTTYALPTGNNKAPIVSYPGLSCPTAVARNDVAQLTYVANLCNFTITAYRDGANGSAAPARVIRGPATKLQLAPNSLGAYALAVDSQGQLYVGFDGVVLRFAANADGNVAPLGELDLQSGGVAAIAVDAQGRLFVAVNFGATYSYPANATGAATPTTTIYYTAKQLAILGDTIYMALAQSGEGKCVDGVATFSVDANGVNASPEDEYCNFPYPIAALAVHAQQLYLAEPSNGPNARVQVYSAQNIHQLLYSIVGPETGLDRPVGLAVGGDATLFVAQYSQYTVGGGPNRGEANLLEFDAQAKGDAAPKATIENPPTGLFGPTGVALDHSGQIYVTTSSSASGIRHLPTVSIYSAGGNAGSAPTAVITGNNTLLDTPTGIAVGAGGRVFVADSSDGAILAFAAGDVGNVAPRYVLHGEYDGYLDGAYGLAIGPKGNLYVTNGSKLSVFGGRQTGANSAPLLQTTTGLEGAAGVAVDIAINKVYVANVRSNSVSVYDAENLSYLGSVSGSLTELNQPTGVAVHGDSLFVYNAGSGEVTVFRPEANGNVPPGAVLVGSKTLLDGAGLMAVGPE